MACAPSSLEHQRRERRRRRHDRVAEAPRHAVAPAVAAGLRQRQPAGREHDRARAHRSPRDVATRKPPPSRATSSTRVPGAQLGAGARRCTQQRLEHVARSIRCQETACRPALRAAARRARGRTRPSRRPGTRAARAGSIAGLPPLKSASVTTALVTLQREPPLTRIFAPGDRAPSSSTTRRRGFARRREDRGRAGPAAPAPTIRRRRSRPSLAVVAELQLDAEVSPCSKRMASCSSSFDADDTRS